MRLLALLIFNLLSAFLGFCRLRWCAEVLGQPKNRSTLLKLMCARNTSKSPPPQKKQNKEKTQKGKRRELEEEEEEEKESILGKKF